MDRYEAPAVWGRTLAIRSAALSSCLAPRLSRDTFFPAGRRDATADASGATAP